MDLARLETEQATIPPDTFGRLNRILNNAVSAGSKRGASVYRGDLPTTTLAWGRALLPAHFAKTASRMHEWLGVELDSLLVNRGSKVNVIGPRGSAKSTIATLCYVLRAAVERQDRYIWIVSDTKEQAQTHLENVKTELVENQKLAEYYPT